VGKARAVFGVHASTGEDVRDDGGAVRRRTEVFGRAICYQRASGGERFADYQELDEKWDALGSSFR